MNVITLDNLANANAVSSPNANKTANVMYINIASNTPLYIKDEFIGKYLVNLYNRPTRFNVEGSLLPKNGRTRAMFSYVNTEETLRSALFSGHIYTAKLGKASYLIGRGALIQTDPIVKPLIWTMLEGSVSNQYAELRWTYDHPLTIRSSNNKWRSAIKRFNGDNTLSRFNNTLLNLKCIFDSPYLRVGSYFIARSYIPCIVYKNSDISGYEKTIVNKAIKLFPQYDFISSECNFIRKANIKISEGDTSKEITKSLIETYNKIYPDNKLHRTFEEESSASLVENLL